MHAKDVRRVTVIGAGTMGAGLAVDFARVGCRVSLLDRTEALLEAGMQRVQGAQQALIAAGLLTDRKTAAALRRIQPTTRLEAACGSAQVLIEAAPEDMALKQQLFRSFDELCPADTILASNTSGLSITAIASATARPARVAGMHFWNPPHLMTLVEVVRGRRTSAATVRTLMDLARRIGKEPILVKRDIPGFVGNRLQFAVFREALHLLAEGVASAEDIDAAMSAGPGLRYGIMGPLRTADLGGLDVFLAIAGYLFPQLAADHKPPQHLADLVRRKKLGAKSGAGFYRYAGGELGDVVQRRDRLLTAFRQVLQREQKAAPWHPKASAASTPADTRRRARSRKAGAPRRATP